MCNRIGKWHHGSEGCVQDHLLIIAATILTPVCQSETRLLVCLLPHRCELQRAGAGGRGGGGGDAGLAGNDGADQTPEPHGQSANC